MLQFITHRTDRYDELQGAREALRGGCRWIQLRMKEAAADEIVRTGRALRTLCDRYGAVLILDDHVELVAETGADGVHLGRHDMAPDEARRLLGAGRIIGGTANTFADLERLAACGVDYIGLGPYRFTQTKKNLSPVLGVEGYRQLMERFHDRGFRIPVVAIGGIEREDIPAIMACGVQGIALSGTLLRAADMASETSEIVETIKTHTHE